MWLRGSYEQDLFFFQKVKRNCVFQWDVLKWALKCKIKERFESNLPIIADLWASFNDWTLVLSIFYYICGTSPDTEQEHRSDNDQIVLFPSYSKHLPYFLLTPVNKDVQVRLYGAIKTQIEGKTTIFLSECSEQSQGNKQKERCFDAESFFINLKSQIFLPLSSLSPSVLHPAIFQCLFSNSQSSRDNRTRSPISTSNHHSYAASHSEQDKTWGGRKTMAGESQRASSSMTQDNSEEAEERGREELEIRCKVYCCETKTPGKGRSSFLEPRVKQTWSRWTRWEDGPRGEIARGDWTVFKRFWGKFSVFCCN